MKLTKHFLLRKAVVYGFADGYLGPDEPPALSPVTSGCNGMRRTAPVGVYASRESAEGEAWRLEGEARSLLNPWWVLECREQLVEIPSEPNAPTPATFGIRIPDPETVQYGDYVHESSEKQGRWYDEESPGWTTEQRGAVWRAVLGDRGFYEVVEIAVEE